MRAFRAHRETVTAVSKRARPITNARLRSASRCQRVLWLHHAYTRHDGVMAAFLAMQKQTTSAAPATCTPSKRLVCCRLSGA